MFLTQPSPPTTVAGSGGLAQARPIIILKVISVYVVSLLGRSEAILSNKNQLGGCCNNLFGFLRVVLMFLGGLLINWESDTACGAITWGVNPSCSSVAAIIV